MGRKGFTLVELMVVVVIIAALATMVIPHVIPASDAAKHHIAQGEIEVLIRPERLKLAPGGVGAAGTILWREYYGHGQRVGVQLHDETRLIVRTGAFPAWREGQPVRVTVQGAVRGYGGE